MVIALMAFLLASVAPRSASKFDDRMP